MAENFTTVAFAQSIAPANAYTAITAAAGEQHIFSTGTQIKVPELNQVVALAAGVDITAESFIRLNAPSLRSLSRVEIEPANTATAAAVKPVSPHAMKDLRLNPLALIRDEIMQCEVRSTPVAAQWQWLVVWLAAGPLKPADGRIFSIRAVGTTTLVVGQWTNVPLTLNEDLPRGRYAVVGMRARSAGCIAGRMVFVGSRWRPGVLGSTAQTTIEHRMFRSGAMGVFGEFEDTDVPSCDFLSVSADAAEAVFLDLIQLRAGPA